MAHWTNSRGVAGAMTWSTTPQMPDDKGEEKMECVPSSHQHNVEKSDKRGVVEKPMDPRFHNPLGGQGSSQQFYPYNDHSCSDNQSGYLGGQRDPQAQAMAQAQAHRSIQASEQMLYDVFEHTIGMIEELEKYEQQGQQPYLNSGLLSHVIPKDKKKPKHDVTAVIEAELTCLRAQLKFAPPEATQKAKANMLKKTLKWAAAREDHHIPTGIVDAYAKNVVQLLIGKPMDLPRSERGRKEGLKGHDVNKVLEGYGKARHQGYMQDEKFKKDPSKEAVLREMRQGTAEFIGIRRLVELEPNDEDFKITLNENGFDTKSLR